MLASNLLGHGILCGLLVARFEEVVPEDFLLGRVTNLCVKFHVVAIRGAVSQFPKKHENCEQEQNCRIEFE